MVTIQVRNLSHINISITALFMLAEVLPSLNCCIHSVLCSSQNKHPAFWADIPWYNVLPPCSGHAGNGVQLLCQQETKWSPFLGPGVLFPSACPSWRCAYREVRPWLGLHGIAACLHVAAVGPHPVTRQLVETHHKSS